MPNEGPLQKQKLIDATKDMERIKEIVEQLDTQVQESGPLWEELKGLVGIEPKSKEIKEEEPLSEIEPDTVESLVQNNTKDQLLELAEKEGTEVSGTKTEIAEAIIAARDDKANE